MNSKLENALVRLTNILPLKERQERCGTRIKGLHQRVLRSFVDQGRILAREEMGQYVDDLDEAVAVLRANDMVVFGEDGEPVGAYPFTMEAREHSVHVNGHKVYAMCALDALAVGPMFNMDTEVRSRCRVTGDPVRVRQSGQSLLNPEEAGELRFGIKWAAADAGSCCADSLCMEMMFLKDGETAGDWLAEDPDNREVFTLPEAIEFGDRFFSPLLARSFAPLPARS